MLQCGCRGQRKAHIQEAILSFPPWVLGTEPRTSSLCSKHFTRWADSMASSSFLWLHSLLCGGASSCHLSSGGQWVVTLWVVWIVLSGKLLYSFLRPVFNYSGYIPRWWWQQSWVQLTENSQTSSIVKGSLLHVLVSTAGVQETIVIS